MSSLMTNASAMTALKTLQMTNKSLDQTENRISTGYKVATASDNAAYWSIATTMRSDNKALSTVQDALGLGAATVDVAYTAMDSVKDVLDQIKTKLVSATQPGVDKSKIQSDIAELQKQVQTYADSASFSGSNWLSVDSGSSSYKADQSIVSSFNRSSDNQVSISTINVDITGVSLFDAKATAPGLLQASTGNTSTGNAVADGKVTGTDAATAAAAVYTSDAFSSITLDSDDSLTFKIDIDGTGTATDVTIDKSVIDTALTSTDGVIGSAADFATVINAALSDASVSGVTVAEGTGADAGKIVFTSGTTGASSEINISAVTADNGTNGTGITSAAGLTDQDVSGTDATTLSAATVTGASAFSAITLDDNDTISFNIAVDGGDAKAITINKALVDTVLGTTDGKIATADNMKDVLNKALSNAGVNNATASVDTGKLVFTSSTTGAGSSIDITDTKASKGLDYGIMDIDVTDATADQLSAYMDAIETMSGNVTTAAANLGSVKSRIDMQQDFVKNLMDAVDRGVGALVDADMSQESTRLQALQTQQQLGIQALSIANSNSQSILSLFR